MLSRGLTVSMLARVYYGYLNLHGLRRIVGVLAFRLVAPAEAIFHVENPDGGIAAAFAGQLSPRLLPPCLADGLRLFYCFVKYRRIL